MKEEAFVIRVEVTEAFTFSRFNEIADTIIRKGRDEYGALNKGDTFWCNKDILEYLMGNNKMKRTFVRIIEVGGQNGK